MGWREGGQAYENKRGVCGCCRGMMGVCSIRAAVG